MSLDEVRGRLARAAILLDFDGTLSPIVARAEDARAVEGAAEAIAGLVERCRSVTIVTGRPADFIREHLPVPGIEVAGLYGLDEGAPLLPHEVLAEVDGAARVESGAMVERKGPSVAVHVRGAPDPDTAEGRLAPVLAEIAGRYGLEVRFGKRVLELVPAGSPGKRDVVRAVVAGADAALYAGDDVADLEAFDALDEASRSGLVAWKVVVRGAGTPAGLVARADEVLAGPGSLVHLLESL